MIDFSQTQYWLAPLAGWTDLPFRATVKKFGVDLTVSEMISSNALVFNSKKTRQMIEKSPMETPYSVQLNGSNSEILKQAVEILNEEEGIDCIDLNSGCPAPKVVKTGCGSSLLENLSLLEEMTRTIKDTSNKEYTSVKVRLGFTEKYGVDIAKAVEAGGADFLVVHGRTRSGGYHAEVDYDAIKEMKEAVKIPVIANGDITSYEKAKEVLEYTGTDGVMIGRGAMGKPWIFEQLKKDLKEPSQELKQAIILEHFDNMVKFYGDHGAVIFRKHLHRYSKGYRSASGFREEVNSLKDIVKMREIIKDFFS
ncbi:MAG: tRNA dihydrouridine synthase DusB [Campylobacterales bacterium]|nr:tRNA dihydrouridine synthase DusB [Campylobacterales bacterium]